MIQAPVAVATDLFMRHGYLAKSTLRAASGNDESGHVLHDTRPSLFNKLSIIGIYKPAAGCPARASIQAVMTGCAFHGSLYSDTVEITRMAPT